MKTSFYASLLNSKSILFTAEVGRHCNTKCKQYVA